MTREEKLEIAIIAVGGVIGSLVFIGICKLYYGF
jgi:L-asparagine transporter-like permease